MARFGRPMWTAVRLSCAALASCAWQSSSVLAREIPRSVLPGIGREASRVPVDVTTLPWRGVGVLQTELGSHCTGALIGPRTVLTAAHCLLSPRSLGYVQPGSIHFLVGYSRGEYAGHSRAATYVTGHSDALDTEGRHLASPPDADWAVITLVSFLGTPDRILPVLRRPPPPGASLALGGYEQDRLHAMVADITCSLLGVARDAAGHTMLAHTCAGTRGASGGPLLAHASDGTWAVIGIVSTAKVGSAGGYAVPVAAIDPNALDAATGR
jgi:protease YdgD